MVVEVLRDLGSGKNGSDGRGGEDAIHDDTVAKRR
jgi:hypothetical protein